VLTVVAVWRFSPVERNTVRLPSVRAEESTAGRYRPNFEHLAPTLVGSVQSVWFQRRSDLVPEFRALGANVGRISFTRSALEHLASTSVRSRWAHRVGANAGRVSLSLSEPAQAEAFIRQGTDTGGCPCPQSHQY
jgi:hypothetical protein